MHGRRPICVLMQLYKYIKTHKKSIMLCTYLFCFWWKWSAYRTTRYYSSANGQTENNAVVARQIGCKLLCLKAKNEFPHLHIMQTMASISGHSVAFWEDAAFHTKVEYTWSEVTNSFVEEHTLPQVLHIFGIGIGIPDDFGKLKKRSVKKIKGKIMEIKTKLCLAERIWYLRTRCQLPVF